MMRGTTRNLMEPLIEAYAIGLPDLVRDLSNASRCFMRHIVAIFAIPVFLLAIILCTIAQTLLGVDPPQDSPHDPSTPTQTSPRPTYCSPTVHSADDDSSSNKSIDNPRVTSAGVGHLGMTPLNPPPATPAHHPPPRAIPSHIKELDCEIYFNNTVINDERVRLDINGITKTCDPAYAIRWLQSQESLTGMGDLNPGEEVRAQLELVDRIFVGPASWLIRVIEEEL